MAETPWRDFGHTKWSSALVLRWWRWMGTAMHSINSGAPWMSGFYLEVARGRVLWATFTLITGQPLTSFKHWGGGRLLLHLPSEEKDECHMVWCVGEPSSPPTGLTLGIYCSQDTLRASSAQQEKVVIMIRQGWQKRDWEFSLGHSRSESWGQANRWDF